eukprot:CAMPEP_0195062740 /NCGR_PEP_ID=MMETSP0448-20130528/9282_1 /TAXON_ID=66468 /ORGANISM="Heterocapsa triquestra, Strain CCMP 448" /LENGTH=60 /DNA_ID=CAMNT_0040093481 /DNA_START=150 /DNA_END=332 /DNA_ORIENTATION=-
MALGPAAKVGKGLGLCGAGSQDAVILSRLSEKKRVPGTGHVPSHWVAPPQGPPSIYVATF